VKGKVRTRKKNNVFTTAGREGTGVQEGQTEQPSATQAKRGHGGEGVLHISRELGGRSTKPALTILKNGTHSVTQTGVVEIQKSVVGREGGVLK